MGNRRFAQVSTSDEDDEVPVVTTRTRRSEDSRQNKRKRIKLQEAEEEEEGEDGDRVRESKRERKGKDMERGSDKNRNQNVKEEEEQEEEEEEEQPQEDAKPVGEPVRVTGKGRGRRNHYEAFEFDGNRYELDISQNIKDGSMTVTGQWFYRPEEADRKGGGNWQSRDTRELFYSFHRDEIPAESVMHKCVVHFVPINKQLPNRKQHPGFIVQKVYDTVERKLWKLTDKDYEDNKQHEIDLLVQKTRARLGDLPDVEPEEAVTVVQDQAQQEDQSKTKRFLRKKNISPLDVTREEEVTTRSDQHHKAETPGSCTSNNSEYYAILTKFKVLTGETHRDKWLERLLQGIQYMCYAPDSTNGDYKVEGGVDGLDHEKDNKRLGTTNGSQEKGQKSSKSFIWPDSAVPAVTALEKASHDALSLDFQKYNQKMRQLVFNLKATELLARRLLNGELEPSKMINMSPNELKDGLTAEEIAPKEPDELERMQMTDARCSRCNELKVGVRDIIQAGHGDRYKLECIGCGHNWYASRDEASRLTIDGPSSAKTVGTVPLATTKFESLEKKLLSPRSGDDKSGVDVLKKSSEAYMPVLEAQRSFGKTKNEENPESTKKEE
ncbi:glutactin-like isoform X2 [Mangifera indica]|uniref:glutactin-like isoform X2 n=1 Tax=Mangifera indica TaxID=29780 RepID=UPI001CF99C87|nr:glutactin-like isoform X2 [Mangifera indica]